MLAEESEKLRFTSLSESWRGGYPGNLIVEIIYPLGDNNLLNILIQLTLCNLTNYSYFNLAHAGNDDILGHVAGTNTSRMNQQISMPAHQVEGLNVKGTALNFRAERNIDKDIDGEHELLKIGAGCEQSWVLDNHDGELGKGASLLDPRSSSLPEMFITQLGIQIYIAKFLNNQVIGKQDKLYPRRSALYLEAQWHPKSNEALYCVHWPERVYE